MLKVTGIHHISSIVGHAQKNIDFYASVLGMRLVKQTLNYDDSSTYHFYFGNEDASTPILTTFPWNDAVNGKNGSGYVGITSLGVNPGTLTFWKDRLASFNIDTSTTKRFNKDRIYFKDLDGLEVELVETPNSIENQWEFNGIDTKHAIKGIDTAVLYSRIPSSTLTLLTDILGFNVIDEDDSFYQLQTQSGFGNTIELSKTKEEQGRQGVGTVHHIAFGVQDDEIDQWVEKIRDAGYLPTEVKDRKYFKSIYFRDKGGILIELATLSPGLMVDESIESLGGHLIIPEHFKAVSQEVMDTLMPIEVREVDKLEGYGYRNRYEFNLIRKRQAIIKEILALKTLEKVKGLSKDESSKLYDLKVKLQNVV